MNPPTINLKALVDACIALDRAMRALDSSGQGDLGTDCMEARLGLMEGIRDIRFSLPSGILRAVMTQQQENET